ncbi:MAG: MBL fold metallo-hydrolase [Clostridia bacterium]|nr:MBL fold metallo-hydrolase [Clostridia bacterium]
MKNSRQNILVVIVILLISLAAVAVGIVKYEKNASSPKPIEYGESAGLGLPGLSAHFIDVGQGDSVLLHAGGSLVLVDAGTRDGGDAVVEYLTKLGVKTLDCVVATHPHSDHIGGMRKVFKAFRVKAVLAPEIDEENLPTTSAYEKILGAIEEEQGCKASYALPGEVYTYGDVSFTVLAPLKQYDSLNNMSIVIRVEYEGRALMLTGDAEAEEENDMLDSGSELSADVLKCGHHGSFTSTSDRFLDAVGPRLAVISCGADNSYGYPHKETLKKLDKRGITTLRTDTDGTVVVCLTREGISYAIGA